MGSFSKLFRVAGLVYAPSDHSVIKGPGLFPLPLPEQPVFQQFPPEAPSYLRNRVRRRRVKYDRVRESLQALNEISSKLDK